MRCVQTKPSIDTQVESMKHNTSKPVFGSGTRDQREKVYQDAESEKTYFGRLSPGPCTYDSKVLPRTATPSRLNLPLRRP